VAEKDLSYIFFFPNTPLPLPKKETLHFSIPLRRATFLLLFHTPQKKKKTNLNWVQNNPQLFSLNFHALAS
jgi:hypothetical protein